MVIAVLASANQKGRERVGVTIDALVAFADAAPLCGLWQVAYVCFDSKPARSNRLESPDALVGPLMPRSHMGLRTSACTTLARHARTRTCMYTNKRIDDHSSSRKER